MTSGDNTITAEVAAGSALSSVLNPYPKILIAAVHGAAIGWGCTQLSSFDLIYAHSQTAFFQTPFASLGIAPEGGSSYNFPRAMGKARAGALLFAGERLSAEEAWIGGLITSAIKAESVEGFLEQVLDKARRIGEFSKEALVLAKGLVREAEGKGAVEARRRAGEKERDGVLRMFETEDTQRRLAGFGAGKTKARI